MTCYLELTNGTKGLGIELESFPILDTGKWLKEKVQCFKVHVDQTEQNIRHASWKDFDTSFTHFELS